MLCYWLLTGGDGGGSSERVGGAGWGGTGWVGGVEGLRGRQGAGSGDCTRGPTRIVAASGCPDAVARIIFVGRIVQLSLAVLQWDTLV